MPCGNEIFTRSPWNSGVCLPKKGTRSSSSLEREFINPTDTTEDKEMANIFYSVMGEGRGHATRARTLTEVLRLQHRVVLFAGGDAFRFLAPLYLGSEVEVREIPSLRFAYRSRGRVNSLETARQVMNFVAGMRTEIRRLTAEMRSERPELVITDFEPLLPRAAEKAGVPYVSLDHQHFLIENDLSSLPRSLRWMLSLLRPGVKLMYRRQAATIVSSFYAPGILPSARKVFQVRSMIRPELAQRQPTIGKHVLVYLRRSTPDAVLDVLAHQPHEFRIYGRGEQAARGNLQFRPISESGFLDDLSSANAVVCAAGNQLLGECLFLGKPVFALPETGQHEQRINAHFLEQSGCGVWCSPEDFNAIQVQSFFASLEHLRGGDERLNYNGTPHAVAAVEECLKRFSGFSRAQASSTSRRWEAQPTESSGDASPV
jgi:uncharacterized protein (TIGR00661 family)